MKRCENPECPDFTMFGVIGEYADSLRRCPKCGEDLTNVFAEEEQPDDSIDLDDDAPPIMGPLAYVATFRDWGPAHIARSALMASGFCADLLDENIVALHWTHSQAVFGFKLVVSGTTSEMASRILEEDRSADLADIEEMQLPESPYDRCPQCSSEKVIWPTLARRCKALSMALFWFILMVPVVAHFQPTRCGDCGHRWFPQWDPQASEDRVTC